MVNNTSSGSLFPPLPEFTASSRVSCRAKPRYRDQWQGTLHSRRQLDTAERQPDADAPGRPRARLRGVRLADGEARVLFPWIPVLAARGKRSPSPKSSSESDNRHRTFLSKPYILKQNKQRPNISSSPPQRPRASPSSCPGRTSA